MALGIGGHHDFDLRAGGNVLVPGDLATAGLEARGDVFQILGDKADDDFTIQDLSAIAEIDQRQQAGLAVGGT